MVQVYNHDVVGYYNRLNRFIIELAKSNSSNTSFFTEHDKGRLMSALDALDSFQAWVTGQPVLDLPETAPSPFELKPAPQLPDIESDDVADLVNLLVTARNELINSQSARAASGFIGFDAIRMTAIVDKARKFVTDYIEKVGALDLPESSPMYQDTGKGHTGTNPTV